MNAPYPKPQPDTAPILNALAALFQPDDVVELRAAQLFFCKYFQAIASGWKSQSLRLR